MPQKDLKGYLIDKQLVMDALKVSQSILSKIKPYVKLSEKVKSEIISGVVEKELAKSLTLAHGFPVTSPVSDNDPDLKFTAFPKGNNSVEIKVALMEHGSGKWRGGEKSQRKAPTLFISRDREMTQAYVSLVRMEKKQWIPASSGKYYAVTYSKKELITRRSRIDLAGSIKRKLLQNGSVHSSHITMNFESLP